MADVGECMNIDQCLFGYEDGHRLLASSLPLGESLSLLTELSDLAPGTIFGESGGYWTGLPVASLGRYVLMRTWPAPEMSRPGCVWTHALLIEPALLGMLEDLSLLCSLVCRPDKGADRARYRAPLPLAATHRIKADQGQDGTMISRILSTLYDTQTTTVAIRYPGDLDQSLFAVWSQQWPRLRRNFRFQTAASRAVRPESAVRFDVVAQLVSPERYAAESADHRSAWADLAVRDALGDTRGDFRAFLWHYARDVRRQRGAYRPLTEIHLLTQREPAERTTYLFSLICRAFPESHEALSLKQDLVDGQIVSGAQAGLIQMMLDEGSEAASVFPLPTPQGVERLIALGSSRPQVIIGLLDRTLSRQGHLVKLLKPVLLEGVKKASFWELSRELPALQVLMAEHDPAFTLASEPHMDEEQLAVVARHLPEDVSGLDEFIRAMSDRDSSDLAETVYDRFTDRAAVVIAARLSAVAPSWRRGLLLRTDLLLKDNVLGQVPRTRLLYETAEQLGWLAPEVCRAGVAPWFYGLVHAKNDLHREALEELGCFILVLACQSGGEEGLKSVEIFFSTVHQQLMLAKLPAPAAEILCPFLPDIGWLGNWDLAERLRLLIAQAFLRHCWEPSRYLTLAREKKAQLLLNRTMAGIQGGRAYTDPASK
ncbi:hypothetical protein E1N66_13495 [Pantoea allii]|nr:hypothetical protein [Pantoea allii]THB83850.1 hypothetical protein E1N66_13495 [Pantoea allii]